MSAERVDTVVVGGGQAGLATGFHLKQRGVDFLIVDEGADVGHTWRGRWDSLRLFTPASFDGLPGMPFPAPPRYFPTKDEMADYLQQYATRFALPVRFGTRVSRLARSDGRYVVSSDGPAIDAARVVVATGPFTAPRIPAFAAELSPAIVQVHSVAYRNPTQLQAGRVLVVGAGNSGAEIALEAVESGRSTVLAGPDTGHIPIPLGGLGYRLLQRLTTETWLGRRLIAWLSGRGDPLIRVHPRDLRRAGVQRAPRVVGARDGRPVLEDGRVLDVESIVWCTGFVPNYRWIDLPILRPDGWPVHRRGVVDAQPGLYFVGLRFQSSVTSHLVGGVGADAEYVVERMTEAAARHARPAARG